MNCPFCQTELHKEGNLYVGDENAWFNKYVCYTNACMVNNDFPRYKVLIDQDNNIWSQDYSIGKYYVKVTQEGTSIYGMVSFLLQDEVKIARPIWLNPINSQATLDKLKLLLIFS